MRNVKYFGLALLALGVVSVGGFRAADKDEKKDPPKVSIKEVMKKAHAQDNGLAEKVTSGMADKAEKLKLLELYTALAVNKPPKGDEDSWKEKTSAVVKAAQDVVDGKEGAEKELKKAINCKACHEVHRPKKS